MDSDTYFSVDLAFNYIKSKKPTNNNNLTSFLLIEFYLDQHIKYFLRIIRFSIVGGISTIINYSCFLTIYKLFKLHYIFSSSTGYLIGLLFGYYFNKYWTFNEKVMIGKLYIVKYSIAQLLGLIFSQLLLYIFVESLYLNFVLDIDVKQYRMLKQ